MYLHLDFGSEELIIYDYIMKFNEKLINEYNLLLNEYNKLVAIVSPAIPENKRKIGFGHDSEETKEKVKTKQF